MKNIYFLFVLFILSFSVSNAFAQFIIERPSNNLLTTSNLDVLNSEVQQQSVGETSKTASLDNNVSNVENDNGFGFWINYQQQFGALDGKLLTIGGTSFGFNLGKNVFIGGGVFSSFGGLSFNNSSQTESILYGGGIVGFRWNPQHPVVFRTQVLVGVVGFDTIPIDNNGSIINRSTSLIVVPEVGFDIRLVGFLYLSISANYRYIENLPEAWSSLTGLGALSGAVSLGLSF